MCIKQSFYTIILICFYLETVNGNVTHILEQIELINFNITKSHSKQQLLQAMNNRYLDNTRNANKQIEVSLNANFQLIFKKIENKNIDNLAFQIVTGKYEAKLDKMKQQYFVNEFHQRIIKKFEIDYDEPIENIQFLYTKKYKTLADVTGFYMILLQKEKQFEIVDISGNTCGAIDISDNYKTIAGNPHNDAHYFLGITENGQMHRFDFHIQWFRRNRNQTQQKVAFKPFSCTINQSSVYESAPLESIDEDEKAVNQQKNQITSVISYLTRGIKYTLAGDNQGNIHVWLHNGTYKGTTVFDEGAILKLVRFYPSILVVTKTHIGFMKPINLKKTSMVCPSPQEEIVDVITEFASNHVFYALLANGEILVYDVLTNTKQCQGFLCLLSLQCNQFCQNSTV